MNKGSTFLKSLLIIGFLTDHFLVCQKFANFLLNNKNFYSKRKQKAKCKKNMSIQLKWRVLGHILKHPRNNYKQKLK